MRKIALGLCIVLCASTAGCSKISLGKLREKNKATIDAVHASFAEMTRVMQSSPAPAIGGACARPGLVLAPKFSLGYFEGAGATGEVAELLDAAAMVKSEDTFSAPRTFDADGPMKTVAWDAWYAKTELSFKVDEKRAQVRYDEAKKVRFAVVARTAAKATKDAGDRADIYLFELPTPKLVCSFAVDVGNDLALAKANAYDPNTGDPSDGKASETSVDLGTLVRQEVAERFGLAVPTIGTKPLPKKRGADDPRVLARAKKVSKAVDELPEKFEECKGDEAKGALRMSKKALRILARGDLLPRNDPNVEIDAKSSTNVTSYLRARDKQSADTVATAESWKVLDMRSGGTAASIDGRSFVGGGASGRLVVFDKADAPVCQKTVRIPPPDKLDTKVTTYRTGGVTTDVGEKSKAYLQGRIDELLGLP